MQKESRHIDKNFVLAKRSKPKDCPPTYKSPNVEQRSNKIKTFCTWPRKFAFWEPIWQNNSLQYVHTNLKDWNLDEVQPYDCVRAPKKKPSSPRDCIVHGCSDRSSLHPFLVETRSSKLPVRKNDTIRKRHMLSDCVILNLRIYINLGKVTWFLCEVRRWFLSADSTHFAFSAHTNTDQNET